MHAEIRRLPCPARPLAAGLAVALAVAGSGCSGDDAVTLTPTSGDAPTWNADVAPIVARSCAGCHAEGEVAGAIPFGTYAQVAPWASAMALATTERRMPPFPADDTAECPGPARFVFDRRLADEDIAAIRAWADAGGPEGDPADAAPLPDPIAVPELARVDQVVGPVAPYPVPTRDVAADSFVCVVVDPGLTEDKFLDASRIVPGNPDVVHHVILHEDPVGASEALAGADGWYPCNGGGPQVQATMIGGYVPGAPPVEMPPGTAVRVHAGARLILEMHYHGVADPVDDSTVAELQWADGQRTEAYIRLLGNAGSAGEGLQAGPDDDGEPRFFIPAGAAAHTETMRFPVDEGLGAYRVFLAAHHMHRVGVRMESWIERPDGTNAGCVLDTPRWDFDWQLIYGFAGESGPIAHDGDTLVTRCTYDNTLDNLGTRRALAEQGLTEPVDVSLGEGSLDEMCVVVVGAVPL